MRCLLLSFIPILSWGVFADDFTYIGDSQSSSSGALFTLLKTSIRSQGSIRSGSAVCGAHIQDFIASGGVKGVCTYKGVTYLQVVGGHDKFEPGSGKTENIQSLMKATGTVVIQLGDNHLDDLGGVALKAKKLATEILTSGKSCVWIGPASVTYYKEEPKGKCGGNRDLKKRVGELIKNALKATVVNGKTCSFVDSFALTDGNPPKSDDCLHYTNYSQWADPIRGELIRALTKPDGKPKQPGPAGQAIN